MGDADGGKSKYSNAGASHGLGYCDAQCPHDLKFINGEANAEDWKPSETDVNAGTGKYGSCCTEIDIWEANSISTAYTMHSCSTDGQTRCEGTDCGDNGPDRFKGLCDKNGCDLQSYRLGNKNFFGPGSEFTVDSTKPITVTTQFMTNDGTNFLEKGGLGQIEKAIDAGVVLVMSLWDDHYANMLWLDSTYPVDSTDPGAARGTCSTDSGVPADVEKEQADSSVIFSDIRFGPIGSTTEGTVSV